MSIKHRGQDRPSVAFNDLVLHGSHVGDVSTSPLDGATTITGITTSGA